MQVIDSKLDYFVITDHHLTTATVLEREGFFLIENANKDLFTYVQGFSLEYLSKNRAQINSKISFQGIMTWISIAVVALCCMAIIPLFGRI